ncbi:hypothetical protein [Streptomyces sp. NBC_00572]|uniref:hypothetical protein n=1 Tax=Streptomyces sp. NBC_00572 TaxID=2903664 RepID=UPI0022500555|nr:hypothetical protein [Streptomyces sp. NBC_00572]MCX4986069.1 hypothetical protein [Streptomyces sp. NBC_00572]
MPERYGQRERIYDRFRCWQRDGTWARIVTQLQARTDAKGLITWDVNVDSTVCRAHQHAAGAAEGGHPCGPGPQQAESRLPRRSATHVRPDR